MRMYDIISKKKYGHELTREEIEFAINGYVKGEIPDYQMSALTMAIYFQSMTKKETTILTQCMAHSGDVMDLSEIDGIKADKHSTGGVGDKTTLVVAPIVAACGVKMAKMSGRGLGHTGGTIDKLESIPGFQTAIDKDRFIEIVKNTGLCVIGQTGNLTPADKKLYALRDVTATVDCLPLIASSIMSKKLAAGADCILLDVKSGSGAFMKTVEDSIKLARAMVDIGWEAGKKCTALVTNMDVPLGYAVGNSLEVIEAVDTLKGHGPKDLTEICIGLAANILVLAGQGTLEECTERAKKAIAEGSALEKLRQMVIAQGGDVSVIDDTSKFGKAPIEHVVVSPRDGYIASMGTEDIGIASVMLGAGRETKDSPIDYLAGIMLHKKTGDKVRKGEPIATLYTSKQELLPGAEEHLLGTIAFSDEPQPEEKLIYARVEKDQVINL
jgi:pyrimidine-nucleoside phosphorylase